MQINLQNNDATKPKHSKLGITAFFILISPVIIFSAVFVLRYPLAQILKASYIYSLSMVLIYWYILAPVIAFVLSIIDLKKSNRLKILPRITLVFSAIIITAGVIAAIVITISDLKLLL